MVTILDSGFRGACPVEDGEQMTFLAWLRFNYPELFAVTFHVKNEGQLAAKNKYAMASRDKKMGLVRGVNDVMIMTCPVICIEFKRKDKTQSSVSKDQKEWLTKMDAQGHEAIVAYGADVMKEYIINRFGSPKGVIE